MARYVFGDELKPGERWKRRYHGAMKLVVDPQSVGSRAVAIRTDLRRSRPDPMHVNKVSRVRTIDRVAKDLGEDVEFLFDVAIEMEPEDGLIWSWASATKASWPSPTTASTASSS